MNTDYDIIIIGSGVGGLATASLLSKYSDKKILIIEQHSKLGGYSHSFRRKKYQWDVGSHYIGDLDDQSIIKKLFDEITDGKLKWDRCPPGSLNFRYPNLNFDFPNSLAEYQEILTQQFPTETASILEYLNDLQKVCNWSNQRMLKNALPKRLQNILPFVDINIEKVALTNLDTYFSEKKFSPKLKQYLEAHWGSYGLIASQTSFIAHAIITNHYLNGLYRPVGGSESIAKFCKEIITAKNTVIFNNTIATEIIVSNNVANAVKTYNKIDKTITTFSAPIIVSNAGVQNTFEHLLPTYSYKKSTNLKITGMTLFLGLKINPEVMGLNKMCYWIFTHDIHLQNINTITNSNEFTINMVGIMSAQKVSDEQNYSVQIFIPMQVMNLEFWKQLNRDEYLKLKNTITDRIFQFMDNHFKSFSKYVDYYELATPLTFSRYSNNPYGEIYGHPLNNYRFTQEFEDSLNTINGLYFTGTDITYPGIAGAAMSGLVTTTKILQSSKLIKFFSHSFHNR